MAKGKKSCIAEYNIITHCKKGEYQKPGHQPYPISGQKKRDDQED